MKPSFFVTSVAAALLFSPVVTSAQPQEAPPNPPNQRPNQRQMGPGRAGAPGEGRGMMERRQAIRAELGLTDAQKADLQKAMESNRRDRLRKTTDLKIAGLDLKSLLRAEKVDEKAVAAKLAEVQAAQGALLKLRVDTALAMKRILTPEQQKKIGAVRGMHRMGARMKMRGMGQGRGERPMLRHGRPRPMMDGRGGDDLELDLEDELEFEPEFDLGELHPEGGKAAR